MAYVVVTRAQWNARPPTSVTPLQKSKVDKFIVHYSGAIRTQTVRSIQNFCMDNKGHSDIDYNYLTRGTQLYIGRGDNEGSHTLHNNATSYGICVIGNDGDATDDDLRTVRTVYDELCVKLGRNLEYMGHNEAPGLSPGYTTCPGSEIQAWINAGMPMPKKTKVIDMFFLRALPAGPEVFVSDGITTRLMPPGTWDTTVVPLTNAGVPILDYKSQADIFKAGGPLVDGSSQPPVALPESVTVTVPAQTLTVDLSAAA